jgi:hypothetical protein
LNTLFGRSFLVESEFDQFFLDYRFAMPLAWCLVLNTLFGRSFLVESEFDQFFLDYRFAMPLAWCLVHFLDFGIWDLEYFFFL